MNEQANKPGTNERAHEQKLEPTYNRTNQERTKRTNERTKRTIEQKLEQMYKRTNARTINKPAYP